MTIQLGYDYNKKWIWNGQQLLTINEQYNKVSGQIENKSSLDYPPNYDVCILCSHIISGVKEG